MRKFFLTFALLAGLVLSLPLLADGPSYWPTAIGDFDGVADHLSRGADLSGNADGKEGTVSIWTRFDGGDGSVLIQLGSAGGTFGLFKQTNDTFRLQGANVAAVTILRIISDSTYTSASGWLHYLASWDLGNGLANIYINGAEDLEAAPTLTNDTINYTTSNFFINTNGAGAFHNGAIAELWFDLNFLDISVEANRRLFTDRAGFPINLGATGEKVTGTAPIIYMHTRANNAGINSGTGGDFVIQGAPLHTPGPFPFFPLSLPQPQGMGSRIH